MPGFIVTTVRSLPRRPLETRAISLQKSSARSTRLCHWCVCDTNRHRGEVDTHMTFEIADKPAKTRNSSVLTDDVLDQLVAALVKLPAGKEIVLTDYPRNTKSSAA